MEKEKGVKGGRKGKGGRVRGRKWGGRKEVEERKGGEDSKSSEDKREGGSRRKGGQRETRR